MPRTTILLFISLFLLPFKASSLDYQVIENAAYTSIMNCDTRLPLAVVYTLNRDLGKAKRYSRYIADSQLMKAKPQCHPDLSHGKRTYQAVLKKNGIQDSYDVGHLAASNHLDASDVTSKLANQFTNLAPQASGTNRRNGAWYHSEQINECIRETGQIVVTVGTIDDPATTEKDYFTRTFRQTTPDYFYRVLHFVESNQYVAWLIPNTQQASKERFDEGEFDITINDLLAILPIAPEWLTQLVEKNATIAPKSKWGTTVKGNTLQCGLITTDVG